MMWASWTSSPCTTVKEGAAVQSSMPMVLSSDTHCAGNTVLELGRKM